MEPVGTMYLELVAGDASRQGATGEDIIELYDCLRPTLEAYLGSRGLDKGHSEDVIQEVFLRLVRHSIKRGARQIDGSRSGPHHTRNGPQCRAFRKVRQRG